MTIPYVSDLVKLPKKLFFALLPIPILVGYMVYLAYRRRPRIVSAVDWKAGAFSGTAYAGKLTFPFSQVAYESEVQGNLYRIASRRLATGVIEVAIYTEKDNLLVRRLVIDFAARKMVEDEGVQDDPTPKWELVFKG